ncbi:uncharacterized protein KD926_006518 [Aspergillus affinis]|uniref:uncharacterized protein n=1 Tax=Aspergillus affinis TaxID=1070780 RepID=UPI0022FF01AC|nr:uncharacterized protein KD926_006518 [Aspergillus affinis]KAI9041794.1 hypothetical protein KD926_006518 [Aspergillus affinis]
MLERADRVNIDPLRDSDIEDFLDPSRLPVCDDPRCEFMARRRENLGSETSGKGSAWNIMIIEVETGNVIRGRTVWPGSSSGTGPEQVEEFWRVEPPWPRVAPRMARSLHSLRGFVVGKACLVDHQAMTAFVA